MAYQIKISDIIAKYRDKMLTSSAIDNYCLKHFGKSAKVYAGYSDRRPPGENEAPFIAFDAISTSCGETDDSMSWNLAIYMGVVDRELGDINGNGAEEMRGLYRLDEMVDLVVAEVEELSRELNMIGDSINVDFAFDYWPLHIARISVESRYTRPIGATLTLGG